MLARRRSVRRSFFDVALQRAILSHVSSGTFLRLARSVRILASASGHGINVAALLRSAMPHEYRTPDSIRIVILYHFAVDLVAVLRGRFESVPAHDVVVSNVNPLSKRKRVVFAVF